MTTAVRLKKPYRIWSKGHVLPEMQDNEAAILIKRGIAEKYVVSSPAKKIMHAGRDYVAKGGK
jgi:hypothetical protein